jgi:hypothetical protein
VKKYRNPNIPKPTPGANEGDGMVKIPRQPRRVNADQDRYGRPLTPTPTKANTKEVYNPKTRVTTLVNKKTGKTFAASMPGPKFRPGVKKGGR